LTIVMGVDAGELRVKRRYPMRKALVLAWLVLVSCPWVARAVPPPPAAPPTGAPTAAAPAAATAVDVLIVHDSAGNPTSNGLVVGNNILDLLGHFGLKGRLASFQQYSPGDVNHYRFVFVLGVDDRESQCPHALVADIRSTAVPVFWVGKHLAELTDAGFAAKLGFRAASAHPDNGYTSVSYKKRTLPKKEPSLFPVEILDAAKAEVVATANGANGASKPYLVRSGSFWYSADSPIAYTVEGDRYLVFCDVLHDFFRMPHQEERKALVRIEDVSVDDDLDELRAVADDLFKRHVPFQIALLPIFRDPADKSEIYLSDRPEFVRTIRYMVSRGGMVVLHGVYHQYHDQRRSGDDYEFWDDMSEKPIQGDSADLVEQRLRTGLDECFKNGIYPVAWETPHYGASAADYQAIGRVFSAVYERVLSVGHSESGHAFPYPSVDRFGRFVIPENLGYISKDNPDPAGLVAAAANLQVVRDGVASFFFHPFMDRKYLAEVLDGLEDLGYHFISIGDYDCHVQMDDKLVQTFTETVRLPIRGHYLHRFLLNADGRLSAESYSHSPLNTVFQDAGVVPPDAVLVMEGLAEITPQKEPPSAKGWWEKGWERFRHWAKSALPGPTAEAAAVRQPDVVVTVDESAKGADWNDQRSYVSALSAFGFRVETRRWQELGTNSLGAGTILVVPRPAAARLSQKQVDWALAFVRGGGRLVLDGPSGLSQAVGVRTEKRTIRVKRVQDSHYGIEDARNQYRTRHYTWNPPADVARSTIPGQISVYARDEDSEAPLAVLAQVAQGRLLYLGAPLDEVTELGYTRYPYFAHYVRDGFDVALPLMRPQVELYFDPGMSSPKIEQLALEWRRIGVRAVYAAAYQFWPKWSYDYAHLIDVCHQNGILVYAWFELPHVSVKFWEEHPEWRAKTVTGKDAGNDESSWRYHMDLDNPDCQDAAFDFVEDLVRKYPWDGVNIAELNHDSEGPEKPQTYTPMGAPSRTAFRALGGFDPMELFDPGSTRYWRENPAAMKKFEEYRAQRVAAWHRSLLERISPIAQERDMEIIVTMLDSLHSPTILRDLGVDSRRIIALMDQFPFTLQVEDPAQFWAQSPDRYKRFGETYLKLVRDKSRLMFDINVVADRDISHSHAPTPTAAGIELAQSLIFAASATGRAAIYSEGTVPFEDLQMLSRVLAHDARIDQQRNAWVTTADHPVLINTPGGWQDYRVDGLVWPGWGENVVSLPAGTHRITPVEAHFTLVDTSVLDLRLLRFTGNLDRLLPTKRGIEFSYDSHMRTLALFNRKPFEVRVDGKTLVEVPDSASGSWSVRLPRGRHRVEVVADSAATVILHATSLYSSTFIFIFGAVACGVMVLLYLAILARRAFGRAPRGKAVPGRAGGGTL
jgi:uncharacterized protein YdaL